MQTIASTPTNAPPVTAQHAEASGLTNDTPFNIINRASKLQSVRKSPINTLPEEIILHIFKLGASSRNSQKRIDFAVLVSHVSRTWRNVAFSCSSLWSDITITADNMHSIDGELAIVNASLLRAKEFASRSRVFPLSVRLKLFITPNIVCLEPGTIMIMNWLRLVLPRVKYLSIHCDTLQVAWLVMKHLHTAPMETLETCKFKYGTTVLSFHHSIIPPPLVRFLFLAGQNEEKAAVNFFPKLTRVKVSGFPVSWSQWSLTRLTSLSINFMSLHDRPSMDMLKHVLTINRETLEKFEIQGAIQQHWPQDFKDGFDLNNPIIQNMPALQPFNNFSSTILLENLVYGWSSLLERVETLALEHFSLPPLFSNLFLQDNDPLKQSHGARVVLAYRMLQTCSQLRRLALINPEECFIHALNMYPDGADPDDTENSGPAPALTHLYLASSHPDRLILFLKRRAESLAKEEGPHMLDYLELATEKKDVGHLLKAIVSDHIDLSHLAKSSLVTGWQGSFTT
ncbi:hypothetical protein DFJ58DRAFT_914032 [Suillus subalutaceus]|uniref:uncharacterized protein n=1 Tax=Suillus subalutaceus TaxID=48586 RepID=UPI001B864EBF|nr:uncharacterized protein DFJ58DRAFT_914032 [Suillus subalutaceus]KAG1854458.1 hypothetical protein DFJ58DRAFT_914032 [Suillus subalutaceus]